MGRRPDGYTDTDCDIYGYDNFWYTQHYLPYSFFCVIFKFQKRGLLFVFYSISDGSPLDRDPFKAIVAPRPIGWISTLSPSGVPNLAPYSFFNAVCDNPPMVIFCSSGMKDSSNNAVQTGEFTFNYVTRSLADRMNLTSGGYSPDDNEFDIAGLDMVDGETVSCPRVKGVPAALECRVTQTVEPRSLSGAVTSHHIIIGEVTGVYIDDFYITDGRFDVVKASPIMRCGYMDYAGIGEFFEMLRPSGGN